MEMSSGTFATQQRLQLGHISIEATHLLPSSAEITAVTSQIL